MFRKIALVGALSLAVAALQASPADARGRRCGGGCGGGGCGSGCYSGGCGGGGCYGGGCATGGCATGGCAGGVCALPGAGGYAAAPTAPAYLTVSLPADARLLIDDRATNSTSETRSFVTPALETGREYTYTLKAQVVRDGKAVVVSKEVTVKPGQETSVTLTLPTDAVAAK